MKKKYISLIVIFLLALFVRFYNLSNIPAGFHIDEASLGYNAYSLMMTGRDASGKSFPLYISMFGDNNPSGYYYLAILPIKLLGLTEFATRLPAALFGSISVFAIYLLSYSIFNSKRIGLISALLLALSPWGIVLARTSAETLVASFFVIIGFGLILLSLNKQNVPRLLIGVISLFLSFFIYPSPRVFVPLLFTTIVIILYPLWLKQKNKTYRNSFIISYLFLLVICLILVFAVSGGTARFNQVSIFNFPETKLLQAEQITEDGVKGAPISVTHIYHNKLINYSTTFISNYFQYFSGDYLFMKGGLPYLLNVPASGLVFLIEFPFILIGMYFLIRKKETITLIPIIWLLLAPISAALTVDDIPNVRRSLLMFPAIELIAAYGLFMFLNKYSGIKKNVFIAVVALLFFYNSSYFLHQYFIHAPIHKTWYRDYGFKQMFNEVNAPNEYSDKIIITKGTGGVFPLILFYNKYDPTTYQMGESHGDAAYTGFGKYFFAPQDCPSANRDNRFPTGKKLIFVDRGDCPDDKRIAQKKTKYILREDGTKAFRIVYD